MFRDVSWYVCCWMGARYKGYHPEPSPSLRDTEDFPPPSSPDPPPDPSLTLPWVTRRRPPAPPRVAISAPRTSHPGEGPPGQGPAKGHPRVTTLGVTATIPGDPSPGAQLPPADHPPGSHLPPLQNLPRAATTSPPGTPHCRPRRRLRENGQGKNSIPG